MSPTYGKMAKWRARLIALFTLVWYFWEVPVIRRGKIFGSINNIQLAEALKKEGFDIDRKSLKIKDEPIKEIGSYEAEAILFKGVKQTFKFEVVSE